MHPKKAERKVLNKGDTSTQSEKKELKKRPLPRWRTMCPCFVLSTWSIVMRIGVLHDPVLIHESNAEPWAMCAPLLKHQYQVPGSRRWNRLHSTWMDDNGSCGCDCSDLLWKHCFDRHDTNALSQLCTWRTVQALEYQYSCNRTCHSLSFVLCQPIPMLHVMMHVVCLCFLTVRSHGPSKRWASHVQ